MLDRARGVCVARCVLGLTLYTRHRAPGDARGVAALLRAFLDVAPIGGGMLFRTSLTPAWGRLSAREHEALVARVADEAFGATVRHLFSVHLADAADAPGVFFHYREVDEGRGVGAGYVQLGLPLETPAAALFQLAMEAAHNVPLWCGTGGYLGSAHPVEVCSAYAGLWDWSRRYLGLDVQDAERGRHHAAAGLAGVNWLTLVGRDLLEAVGADRAALAEAVGAAGADWIDAPGATLVRAGAEPTLGDANLMQYPERYGRAAAALAPLAPKDPPRWYGGFWEDDGAARWSRRFTEPEGWS